MNKFVRFSKRLLALFIVAILNINTYATTTSNDGSAFVTKAEFDTLINNFNKQMNIYQADLNAKIDNSIASYIGGLSGTTTVDISLPGYLWMKSYGNDVNLVELGIDTRKTDEVKDEKDMFRFGKLYTYFPKYYFNGSATACVGYSANAVYRQEIYVNHIISGKTTLSETNAYDNTTSTGRNYSTSVKEDKLISINPSIYLTESGKNYVNKVVKAPKVIENEVAMTTSQQIPGQWTWGGFLYYWGINQSNDYNLFGMNENGVVTRSNKSIPGFRFEYRDVCTWNGNNPPSGYTNVGSYIYGRNDVWMAYRNNYNMQTPVQIGYSRIVNYTNETNHIVPRFLKLPDDVSSQDATKVVAVTDKKGNDYGKIKNQLVNTVIRQVGATKVWYPVGNLYSSDASYKPLSGGIAYTVKQYMLNSARYKATELYDYFVKENYNTDVTLADRVIVYRNEELDKVTLQFKIVPTSDFLLTFSSNKEYQDGETNLYTFKYSGGSDPIEGSGKQLAIDSTLFSATNPLNIEIEGINVNNFVWLGGQSINDGYVTFRFLEKAKILK